MLLYILLCFCFSDISYAEKREQSEILVVIPRDVAPYRSLVESLQKQFKVNQSLSKGALNQVRFRVVALDVQGSSFPKFDSFKPNQLVITFGAKATGFALASKQNIRVASSFITMSAIQSLLEQQNRTINQSKLISVLYLEQPISRIVSLLRILRPDTSSVGAVYGPISVQNQNALIKQAHNYRLKVNDALLSETDNPLKKLQHIFKASQTFLILPDKSSFNRRMARWVITLSVKYKVPVIGFSQKYTQAGALASIYSRPAQIGKQTAEMIGRWLNIKESSQVEYIYPKYFEVSVNRKVAKSLSINTAKESVLREQILRMDNATITNKTRATHVK